jgi:GAF domain-containing protein
MTSVQPPPAPTQSQQQQFLNGITARLALLARDPPDLLVYLRVHAECVTSTLKPIGFAYEMQSGSAFQRLLQGNLESLGYKDYPEQENAFQRARSLVADQRKPLFLPPQTRQSSGLQGLPATDSPAPDELAVFNHTAYEQVFVPIPHGDSTAGILHIWFPPANGVVSQTRVALLRELCNQIENYLKNRRAREVSYEITRVTTYARLLEELTGDIDLESVSWKLVNYAREAVACERVCVFIASDYGRAVQAHAATSELEYEFQLQACSGLKKPHPRSEERV